MEVYFDSADMAGNEVELNVDVLCGGVELYIPKNWGIKVEADCVLGGIDQPNGAYDEKEKDPYHKGQSKDRRNRYNICLVLCERTKVKAAEENSAAFCMSDYS